MKILLEFSHKMVVSAVSVPTRLINSPIRAAFDGDTISPLCIDVEMDEG